MKMEFRAYLTVRAPEGLPPDAWDQLGYVMEDRFDEFGPIFSYWPDRPIDTAQVTLSTDQVQNRAYAAAQLTAMVDDALVAAGLADCYVAGVEVERVPDEELVPA